MERPQEPCLVTVEVIALHNLVVRDHHSEKLNEDECGGTRAEGVPEIPVVDRFGVLLLGSIRLKCSYRVKLRAGWRSVQRCMTSTDDLYIVSCDFEFWTVRVGDNNRHRPRQTLT